MGPEGKEWSPPVRGRGLKHYATREEILARMVAPRAGARVETKNITVLKLEISLSPPVRGRGLKPRRGPELVFRFRVAPRAGARIETLGTYTTSMEGCRPP